MYRWMKRYLDGTTDWRRMGGLTESGWLDRVMVYGWVDSYMGDGELVGLRCTACRAS